MIHNFPPPIINETSTIWRFVDFTKFSYLIETRTLYFCRSDLLGDPFEGSTPLGNFSEWVKKSNPDAIKKETLERMKSREYVYVNCWHMNEYESAAMWNIYAQSGIAIKSTIKDLRNCFDQRLIDEGLFTGEVEYLDYKKEKIPEDLVTNRFFYKRKSFEYENEVRAIFIGGQNDPEKKNNKGISIAVNLDILINDLYVGPNSPDELLASVNNICLKYKINRNPIKTSLEDEALF